MIDRSKIKEDLRRDEGIRRKPYVDTVGKVSIGVGRNLTDIGLSSAEIEVLLDNDLDAAETDLDRNIKWWRDMPEPASRALANMAFNMGWPRLSQFKDMLSHLRVHAYDRAADAALDSKWAGQVGERATRIATLFRTAKE